MTTKSGIRVVADTYFIQKSFQLYHLARCLQCEVIFIKISPCLKDMRVYSSLVLAFTRSLLAKKREVARRVYSNGNK